MGKFVLNITPWTLLISGWLGDCLESFEKNSVNQNCLIRLSCSLAGGDTRKLGLSSGAPVQLGSNIITNWINDKYITRTEPWTLFYCFTFTILLDYFFCLLLVVLWSCTQVFSFVVCCCRVAWPMVVPPIPRQFNQLIQIFSLKLLLHTGGWEAVLLGDPASSVWTTKENTCVMPLI